MEQQLGVCRVATYIPIKKLKFHPANKEIRIITRERLDDLKESIKEKGFYEPILVQEKKNRILAGEHRTRAALELIDEGWEFINDKGEKNHLPVVLEDCNDQIAYQILHESNNHYATWIEDRLNREIAKADAAGENIRQYGYSQDQIDTMLKAAIKDADEISDKAEEDDLDDTSGVRTDDTIERDRFESLVLPQDAYRDLMGILSQVARSMDPEWTEGDSVVEATKTLCEAIRAAKILD